MCKFIKIFFTTLLIMFSVNTVVYADTLNEAIIAANCSDSDDASCNGECTQTSNIITIETTGDNAGGVSDKDSGKAKDSCNEKPDEYRITFYKAGVCETDPYDETATLNPTISKLEGGDCYNFFEDEAGKAISLAYDATTDSITQTGNLITESLKFELGTYNYAYVIVDNHLAVKHTQTFSSNMQGSSDGASFSSGLTCWTNGVVTTFTNATGAQRDYTALQVKDYGADGSKESLAMECGAEGDAAPVYNVEIIENMSDSPGSENENFQAYLPGGYQAIDGGADLGVGKLLKDDDLTTANSYLTAARIFYPIRFATPLIVTRETSVFEMSFGVSGSVSLDFSSDGANKLIAIKAGADPFTMKFTTR